MFWWCSQNDACVLGSGRWKGSKSTWSGVRSTSRVTVTRSSLAGTSASPTAVWPSWNTAACGTSSEWVLLGCPGEEPRCQAKSGEALCRLHGISGPIPSQQASPWLVLGANSLLGWSPLTQVWVLITWDWDGGKTHRADGVFPPSPTFLLISLPGHSVISIVYTRNMKGILWWQNGLEGSWKMTGKLPHLIKRNE